MTASECRRILPTLAGCGIARFRGLCRSLMQPSHSCMLALFLSPWLARCVQSSQGILTAFLRRPLERLGCGKDDVDAGFDIGVGGGVIAVFLWKRSERGQ